MVVKINNKSDFKINEWSESIALEVPFEFSYYIPLNKEKYVASFDGHKYINCTRLEDGSLDVIFNSHGLGIGRLKVVRKYYVDDSSFADGVFDVTSDDLTDVFLTSGKTFDTYVSTLVVPPYLKGDKGDPMTWNSMTDKERGELVEDIAEAIDPEMVMTENEKSRQEAEQSRQTAEQQRSTTFNTLKGEMQSAITAGNAAAGNAQKVVDNYDAKVAEQDGKLSELGSEVGKIRINISEKFPTEGNDGNRYTFDRAITKVKSSYRKFGLIIDFIDMDGFWRTYRLLTDDINDYYSSYYWEIYRDENLCSPSTLDLNTDITHLFSPVGYITNNASLSFGNIYRVVPHYVSGWSTLFIRVAKNDKYTLENITGGTASARAYGVFDLNGTLLRRAETEKVSEVIEIDRDGYIVFNHTTSVKGKLIANRMTIYGDASHTILYGLNIAVRELYDKIEPLLPLPEKVNKNTEDIEDINSVFGIGGNFYTGEYVDGFIVSANGNLSKSDSLANAKTSVKIPIQGNKVYCLSGRVEGTSLRCINSEGKNIKVLAAMTGEPRTSDWYLPSPDGTKNVSNGQFKTPANAVSIQFGITLYKEISDSTNSVVLELVGDSYNEDFVPSAFEGYGTTKVLKKEHFPKEILSNTKTESNTIFSLKDCPLLVVSAASHGEGFGSIKDKSFISYFSSLVDYNVENYSASGSNSFVHGNMIMKDSAIAGVKPSDLGQRGGYVVIVHGGDNEGGYFRNGIDGKYYERNIIRECKAWESLGFKPILSGYWGEQAAPWATIVQSVAAKYGYKYININASNYRFYKSMYTPWWYNAHFGSRTCALQWYGLIEVLKWMPRPLQSIKIFRPRKSGESLDNLLYDNVYERMEKWIELSLHHQALKDGFENYVDRLDLYKSNINSLNSVTSEYATLRSGGSINISEKALVQIVLPSVNVDALSVNPIVSGNISVYARKLRDADLVIDSGISSAIYTLDDVKAIKEGDTLTDSNNSGISFVVVDVNGNMITCTASAEFATEGNMIGTLTSSSGVTYSYSHLGKGPGSNYFNQITKKFGEWVELSKSEDSFIIENPSIYMEYDTIDLCIVGTNFTLSDIKVSYKGGKVKDMDNTFGEYLLNEAQYKGDNILPVNTFNNPSEWNVSGNHMSWDGVTELGNHIPDYYKNNLGCNSILRLNKGAKVSQSVNIKGDTDRKVKKYKVKLAARYYPEEYSNVNSVPSNGITKNSFDIGKLNIRIKIANDAGKSYYTDTLYIPPTFVEVQKEYTFDFWLSSEQILEFEAETDNVELLYCKVLE